MMLIDYGKGAEFIESFASKDGEYYHFPFYFKKLRDNLFEVTEWKERPGELKHIIEQSENPNPEQG